MTQPDGRRRCLVAIWLVKVVVRYVGVSDVTVWLRWKYAYWRERRGGWESLEVWVGWRDRGTVVEEVERRWVQRKSGQEFAWQAAKCGVGERVGRGCDFGVS